MKFEIWPERLTQLPMALQPAIEAWRTNRPVDAYRYLMQVARRKSAEFNPTLWDNEDCWLFAMDVANGCGLYEQADLIAARGVESLPSSHWLQLIHAWNQSADGLLFDCQERLDRVEPNLPAEFHALHRAIHAYNFAFSGWRISAEREHKRAVELAGDDVFALYVLSRAAARRSEWHLAIELGQRVLKSAPHWTRARGSLVDAVLARNDLAEAKALYEQAPENANPFYVFPLSESFVYQALGDLPNAIGILQRLQSAWPLRSRNQRFCYYQLAALLQFEGLDAQADELIREMRLPKMKLERGEGSRKKLINLPLVSQNFNHCVPTVAAMVAVAQGVEASANEFAIGMGTKQGTPIWRMVDFMRERGFAAYCVKAEIPIVEYFLERNVPLIGSLIGLFSSHVDVLCGFDEGLQLFHYRDPMHWVGRSMSYEGLAKKYRNSEGLWAFVAPHRSAEIQIDDAWLDRAGAGLVDLHRATSLGDLNAAETAFLEISDDHPLALSRDQLARCVVITPNEFDKRLSQHATISDSYTLEQLRALLINIDERNAQETYDLFQTKRAEFGESFVDFVQAQCLMSLHKWTEALDVMQRVHRKIPQLEAVWGIYSEVLEQLGRRPEAIECVQHALDIAPDNLRYQRRLLDLQSLTIPYAERLAKVQRIYAESAEPHYGKSALAEAYEDSGDGLELEAALKACIEFFPRTPFYYQRLAGWYLSQSRRDLAGPLLKRARDLMGETEVPLWDFETEQLSKPSSSSPAEETGQEAVASTVDEHIPLANLVEAAGTPTDPKADEIGAVLKSIAESNFVDAIAAPDVANLLARDERRELAWLESVRLRATLVRLALREIQANPDETNLAHLRQILPGGPLPGLPDIYAQALFDSLDGTRNEGAAAVILLNWLKTTCPDCDRRAGLAFEKAWLLEQQDLLTDAEACLDRLADAHPAYAPVWYRKGMIAANRRDFGNARQFMKKALEVNPGLSGAVEELNRLADFMQSGDIVECRKLYSRLMPYSSFRHYLTAYAIAQEKGKVDPGLEYLDANQAIIGVDNFSLLRARLLADFQHFDRALEEIKSVVRNDENATVIDWLNVDSLLNRNEHQAALEILNQMLDRNPEDEQVTDQIVRCLREVSVEQAQDFAVKKLREGSVAPVFAFIATGSTSTPVKLAAEIIEQAPAMKQLGLVNCFADIFESAERFSGLLPFLEWASQRFPSCLDVREKLAWRYNQRGKITESIKIAEDLQKQNPEDPRWLRLLGDVWQDRDPKKSIEFLKQEFAKTGRADTLTRLARGYQLAGDGEAARKHYHEALAKNPFDGLAITNLHLKYGESDQSLFQMATRIVEAGMCLHDQYFLIVVVRMAISLGKNVPIHWLKMAQQRQAVVRVEGGFQDESLKLRRAIAAWAVARPYELSKLEIKTHFWDRIMARFGWPGLKWVPPVVENQNPAWA